MKKTNLVILFFLLILVNLSAFEGGGIFKAGLDFGIGKEDINISHYDRLSLWAKQNIDQNGNYNFSVQTSYLFRLKKPIKPAADLNMNHFLNLDVLKFSFLIPIGKGNIDIDVGRRNLTDITGIILNQNMDGVFLSYTMPRVSVFFNLGYTGLLNAYFNPLSTSEFKSINEKNTVLYKLAPSLVHFSGAVHVPFGALRHSFNFDINSFISTSEAKDTNHYLSALIRGPIISSLFYTVSASTAFMTREGKTTKVGFFVEGDLDYYFNKYSAKLSLNMKWFSGGKNEFQTLSLANASQIKLIPSKDLLQIGIAGSIKPLHDLFLSTDFNLLMKSGMESSGKFFKGFEWFTSVNYNVLQDMSVGSDIGLFIGHNGKVNAIFSIKGLIAF